MKEDRSATEEGVEGIEMSSNKCRKKKTLKRKIYVERNNPAGSSVDELGEVERSRRNSRTRDADRHGRRWWERSRFWWMMPRSR